MTPMFKTAGLDQALKIIRGLRTELLETMDTETVQPKDSAGRVAAEVLNSPGNIPPEAQSIVDGYALGRGSGEYRVVGESHVGGTGGKPLRVSENEAVYVVTGAPLPEGTLTVAPVEKCELKDRVLTCHPQNERANIRGAGTEIRSGQFLIGRGESISPAAAGLLDSLDFGDLTVYPRIRVTVLPTGDEVVSGRVKQTNSTMAECYLRSWNCEPVVQEPVGDEPAAISRAVKNALTACHALIISGGTAVGARDFTERVISGNDFEPIFCGIDLKPGNHSKLSTFSGKPVLALSGRPAAFLVGLHVLARPLFAALPPGEILASPTEKYPPPRQARAHLVRFEESGGDFPLCVRPSSSMLASAYILQRAGDSLPEPCRCILLE